MRRLAVSLLLLLAFGSVGNISAAGWQPAPGIIFNPTNYTGPIDIVASPTAFYWLRAGSAAIATTGTQSIVDLRRPSDNATCTAPIAASGGALDLLVKTPCNSSTQTVTAWTNNDSSCTGSITATTLTVASCTKANLTVGLPITDANANITAGTVIIARGTGTGGAGTYTVNISQTASAVFTAPGWAPVSQIYDQSGNNTHCTQATAAKQPILVFNVNGLPALYFDANASSLCNITLAGTVAQPWTMSAVAERANAFNAAYIMSTRTSFANYLGYAGSTANTLDASANGGPIVAAGNDNAMHALQFVANNTSSVLDVDNATVTTGSAGTQATTTAVAIGGMSGGGSPLAGFVRGAGLWPVGFTSGNRTAMCHNEFTYDGSATSC